MGVDDPESDVAVDLVVDAEVARCPDRPDEVDRLADLQPRRADGREQEVDVGLGHRERVARVVDALVADRQQVAAVVDAWQVVMDDRVLEAHDIDGDPDVEGRPRLDDVQPLDEVGASSRIRAATPSMVKIGASVRRR